MKVLVVGGGGREHAIIHKLKSSTRISALYCAPGNGGISLEAQCVPIGATDIDGMIAFAKSEGIELVVVAPDDPLAIGMVDALEAAGIRAFGPHKNAAIIEASKSFSKDLMKKYNIPTAGSQTFDDYDAALAYIREKGAPIVVKADGLALGKGVVVALQLEEAENALIDIMKDKKFGASGARVVIEDFMSGPEVSVLCFTDGETVIPMLSAQDHKRVFDDNLGPNTGGMGAFCPSPRFTAEHFDFCMKNIFIPTVDAMNAEGREFRGVLYFGLMLTDDGPRVVEYNARFGDPEAQPILSMLETDLLDIFEAIIDGNLKKIDITWKSGYSCGVVLCSGGYPEKYETGYEISGLNDIKDDIFVYHSGTTADNGVVKTAGGRVLCVTATGGTLAEAAKNAYSAAEKIQFTNLHMRTDIGAGLI